MRIHFISIILLLTACRSEKSVVAVNAAPQATIVSPVDGQTVLEGYRIEVRGQVSDANHNAEDLEAAWYYGSQEICAWSTPDSGGGTTCSLIPDLDVDVVTLEVRDPEGAGGVGSVFLDVEGSEAPVVEILSPSVDGVFYTDRLITFEATVTDAEDDADTLDLVWNSGLQGDLELPSSPNASGGVAGAIYLDQGEHFIQLTATDQSGKSTSENLTIMVGPPNSPPSCSIDAPTNGAVGTEGDVVVFEATVSDVDIDADDLLVEWVSDKDGVLGQSNPTSQGTVTFAFGDLSVNTHNISMQVTDELGESCTAGILYTVGTPPEVSILTPTNGETFAEGEVISFSFDVSDLQDQPDEIALDLTLDNLPYATLNPASTGIAEMNDVGIPYGVHTLQVTATDTDGLTDTAQLTFTVNGVPTPPVISIVPSAPYTSDDLSVNILTQSIDPEGAVVSYGYQWLKNGVAQTGETNPTLANGLTTKNDVWTVQVTPTDGQVFGTTIEETVQILNSDPIISNASITPSAGVYNDMSLTCTASVSDLDETVTPTYTWTVGGQTVTGNPLDLSMYTVMPNDTVTCDVLAVDGDAASASDTIAISIDNRVPTVSSVTVTPSILYSDSVATCTHSSQDLDGQSLTETVEWFNAGTSIGAGITIDLTGLVTRNDAVYCTVSVDDGSGIVSASSTTSFVSNTAPTSPNVVLTSTNTTGNPVAEEDDLICEVTPVSTDIDGDTLLYTYDWYDSNGALVGGGGTPTTDTSDVMSATTPTTTGIWTCEVEVSDGVVSGGSNSASITVETGCLYGEFDCPGTSCEDILNNGGSIGDGIYYIDPDSNGTMDVYCDMQGGGWTLLLTANGQSTYWGNNSPNWSSSGTNSAPSGLANSDYHGPAYNRLFTNEIRLCLEDASRCHIFNHQLDIPLKTFFSNNITYTEFSYDSYGHANVGSSSLINQYESEMNLTVTRYTCQWLGINDQQSYSSIGFLADNNGGCTSLSGSYRYHDDTALGVGLQSCVDANSCSRGGSGHKAGQNRAVNGGDPVLGPWFVFGR